jgi:hypothetical protein
MHTVFVTKSKPETELRAKPDYSRISNFADLSKVQIETLIANLRNGLKYCDRVAVLVSPDEFQTLPQQILDNAEVVDLAS